jgi:hypothetical protein
VRALLPHCEEYLKTAAIDRLELGRPVLIEPA